MTSLKDRVIKCVKEQYPDADVDALWDEGLKNNNKIIQMLRSQAKQYSAAGQKGKSLAMFKAANSIVKHKVPIVSGKVAIKIPFIGESIAKKIDDFLTKGAAEDVPMNAVIKLFSGVWGAGPSRTTKWYDAGYRTLDDLLKDESLTKQERIGIEYYDQLNKRIPRDKVTELFTVLQESFPNTRMEIAGSYRRKLPTVGDVDVLIEDSISSAEVISTLRYLEMIEEVLLEGPVHSIMLLNFNDTYMKLDIWMVPKVEWVPTLLYFTGSQTFNLRMRGIAKSKKLLLNQHGLYRMIKKGEKILKGKKIPLDTEYDYFIALGMEYLEPEDR